MICDWLVPRIASQLVVSEPSFTLADMAFTSNRDPDHAEEPQRWRIRPMTAADVREATRILDAAIRATRENTALYSRPCAWPEYRAGWVAVDAADTVIGAALAHAGGARPFCGSIGRRIALLQAVAVAVEHRGRHIGKALVDAAAQHYRSLEFRLLHALVADPRTDLSATYRAWGWHVSELGAPPFLDLGRDRHVPITRVVPPPRTMWVALTDGLYVDDGGGLRGVLTIDELTSTRAQTDAVRALREL